MLSECFWKAVRSRRRLLLACAMGVAFCAMSSTTGAQTGKPSRQKPWVHQGIIEVTVGTRNHAAVNALLVTVTTTDAGTPRVKGAILSDLPTKLTAKLPPTAPGTSTYDGSQLILRYDDGYVVRFVKARDANASPGAGPTTVVVSTFDRLAIADGMSHRDVAKAFLR
jgi:hypothetical protein